MHQSDASAKRTSKKIGSQLGVSQAKVERSGQFITKQNTEVPKWCFGKNFKNNCKSLGSGLTGLN